MFQAQNRETIKSTCPQARPSVGVQLHWPGTFFAGRGDRFILYIVRRPGGGNYEESGVGIRETELDIGEIEGSSLSIFTSSWFISKRTVIFPWVRQHWRVGVWSAAYFGDLCLIACTVIRSGDCAKCALSSASPWLCCFRVVRYAWYVDISQHVSCGPTRHIAWVVWESVP